IARAAAAWARRTEVGLGRLRPHKVPISGKPDIGPILPTRRDHGRAFAHPTPCRDIARNFKFYRSLSGAVHGCQLRVGSDSEVVTMSADGAAEESLVVTGLGRGFDGGQHHRPPAFGAGRTHDDR